ncbi:MAG: DUF5362 family protein [Candidatus Aenigmatarchaeota archaeon]
MVQLLKLEMEGFGKFDKERTIDFGDGVNFITGLNEAGKSTVLEGIMASIFKYTRGQIEPFLCWENQDVCRTALTYKIAKGETFRISSNYKSGKRRLDKVEKSKVKEISSVDKNIEPYLKEHFGFDDKRVFENTAFIRQSQMAILEDATVRNRIKDMVEEVFAGRSEASATKALAKMKKIAKDSSKEIETLEDEQGELKEKLKSAEATKENVVKDSGEYDTTVKKLEEKSKELEKLQKSKKLFDEKEGLLKDQKHADEQMEKVDELLEAVSEEKEEVQTGSPNKTIGIIMIIFGGLLSLTGIGAIIGLPLLIWGIITMRKREKKVKAPVKTDAGAKKAKYHKEKKDLLNKKAVLEDRLENYKLVNFNSNDFDDLEGLKQEVDTLKAKKVELQTSIKTTNSLVESPEDIREKLDTIEENKINLGKRIEEHELAAKFLGMAETQVQHKFTPSIEKNSKPLLKEITNQRYSDLKIEEDTMDIKVKVPETKDYVDVSLLSQGARDQLYFALRTVMSDLLGGNINIPLILDDPFHNFDQTRLNKTIDTIKQISKDKQIILISHRPYHQEFKGFCNNVIEL